MAKLEKVTPSANNYMRGGARVMVRRASDAETAGWIHLGNIVSVTVSPQVNSSEHITGIDGRREVDKRYTDVRALQYQVQCDENAFEIVRLWMQGGAVSQATQTAVDLSSGAKKLSEVLRGITAYTDIVAGRWYDLSKGDTDKTRIFNLDKTYVPDSDYPTEHVVVGERAMVEGTGFLVDYYGAKIMFYTAPAADHAIKLKATALAQVQSFDKLDVAELDIVAEGWYVYEDGEVVDKWDIPRARIEPSGGSAISIENPQTHEFTIVQLKHSTEDWGTFVRFYPTYQS